MILFFYVQCDREKDNAVNPIDKTVTEKQQEQEKVSLSEEIENNQEGATNEAEEKEDKVCLSLHTALVTSVLKGKLYEGNLVFVANRCKKLLE